MSSQTSILYDSFLNFRARAYLLVVLSITGLGLYHPISDQNKTANQRLDTDALKTFPPESVILNMKSATGIVAMLRLSAVDDDAILAPIDALNKTLKKCQ